MLEILGPAPEEVSIRPQLNSRGKLELVFDYTGLKKFQSAPSSIAGGNRKRSRPGTPRRSFNPPPAQYPGETEAGVCRSLSVEVSTPPQLNTLAQHDALPIWPPVRQVSIRPQLNSRGKR